MIVVIHHFRGGIGPRNYEAQSWLAAMSDEHDSYYGKPHGADWRGRDVRGVSITNGYICRLKAAELATTVIGKDFSTADLLAAVQDPDIATIVVGHIEIRFGRRHGVRRAMACEWPDKWAYIESQCPDANPDCEGIIPGVASMG